MRLFDHATRHLQAWDHNTIQDRAHTPMMQARDDQHTPMMQARDDQHTPMIQARDDQHTPMMQARDDQHTPMIQAYDGKRMQLSTWPCTHAHQSRTRQSTHANRYVTVHHMRIEQARDKARMSSTWQRSNGSSLNVARMAGRSRLRAFKPTIILVLAKMLRTYVR